MADPIDYGYGKRQDGSLKGQGYFGPLKRPDGGFSTELTVGVDLGNGERDIPALVPTLTQSEIDSLLRDERPSDAIMRKAIDHARHRLSKGLSPFADNAPDEPTANTAPLYPVSPRRSPAAPNQLLAYSDTPDTTNALLRNGLV